jgi:hypothetical protein
MKAAWRDAQQRWRDAQRRRDSVRHLRPTPRRKDHPADANAPLRPTG